MEKVDNKFSRAVYSWKNAIIGRVLYVICYPFKLVYIDKGSVKFYRWCVAQSENIVSVHFLFKTKSCCYRCDFKMKV